MKLTLTTKILLISAAVITTLMDPTNMVNAMVDTKFNDKAIAAQANHNSWGGGWIVQVDYGDLDRVKEQAAQISTTRKKDFKVLHTFKDEKGMNALVLEGISIEDIKSIPGVTHVSPDILVYADEYSWGIDRSDQLNLPLDQSAYSPAFTGCGVDVYVLDTGVDTQHIEFEINGNGRVVENIWNAYGSVTDNTDGHGHGSHCAGTVGGNTVGVAPCANIYGMKVLSDGGSGRESDIVAALNEVKRRHLATPGSKSVVSMSLGGTCSGSCSDDAMVKKVQELADLGIISSLAAGNSNDDSESHTPAAAPDALTVGSTTSSDRKSSFSNHGSLIDVQAPGSSITSVCSRSRDGCADGQSYWTISGTSMACPHVTGVIAQNLEKGTHVAMVDLDAVNQVRASIICDSVKNKISGVPSDTTGDLLQVPTDDGKWACQSMESVDPTVMPTVPPTAPVPSSCPAFTASDTDSASQNTVTCPVTVCPGTELTFETCDGDGKSCNGDTFLRLMDGSGNELAVNDDNCGFCSRVTYEFTAPCQEYILNQGCFEDGTCGGTTAIVTHGPTAPPIVQPTTAPTASPTTGIPATCGAFSASDTSSATKNTVGCEMFVCPGEMLTIASCHDDGKACNGDTFLRLLDESGAEVAMNDDRCGFCSSISHEFTAPCQSYMLQQGCYADGSCSGESRISQATAYDVENFRMKEKEASQQLRKTK